MLSYDEETTCLGVLDTIARMGKDLPRPQAVIVGEPTELQVADAHKSVVTFNTNVHGHESHSSKPALGANAVLGAAALVWSSTASAEIFQDARRPDRAFRSALRNGACRHHPGRHGAQHRAASLCTLPLGGARRSGHG